MKKEEIARLRNIKLWLMDCMNEISFLLDNKEPYPMEKEVLDAVYEHLEKQPEQAGITQIGVLKVNDEHVVIQGEIVVVNRITTFPKTAGGEGRVRNIQVDDGTGSVAVPLWDDQIEQYSDLYKGDVIKV